MNKYKSLFSILVIITAIVFFNACSSSSGSSDNNQNWESPEISMVSVPGGTYSRGWDFSACMVFATPIHSVTLSGFQMGKYEITNAEVAAVFNWAKENNKLETVNAATVTNKGDSQELLDLDHINHHITYNESEGTFSVTTGLGDDGSGGSVDLSDYPILLISWYGAAAFCNYLSEMEGLTPCYDLNDWSCDFDANGYRLPTEAEWEYAARYDDGSDFTDGDWFSAGPASPGGTDADALSWNSLNSDTTPHCNINTGTRGTHEVGTKSPNFLGIYDMTGNIYEWCNDWSDTYSADPQTDPAGPSSGTGKIYRGGGIGCNPSYFECGLENSIRAAWAPDGSDIAIGFRIAGRI